MTDIIIIGAGTAGLSAAIYCSRAGKNVIVFEEKVYGGQIVTTPRIDNYPGIKSISGFEFATDLYNQVKELGSQIIFEKVISIEDNGCIKTVNTNKGKYQCKAVIIATGSTNRKLGLDNEDKFTGRGVSYCATCDGTFYKERKVAVYGGGNTALSDAVYLAKFCYEVNIIHRRDIFRAEEALIAQLKLFDNINYYMENVITALSGDDKLTGLRIENVNNGLKREINVDGLFVAIGQIPASDPFSGQVMIDDTGYIVAGEDCRTDISGIFTAGDCRTKRLRQLTTATSDGAVAGVLACEYSMQC